MRAGGQVGDGFGLDGVAAPAHRLGGADRDRQALGIGFHELGVVPPAAGDDHFAGLTWQALDGELERLGGEGHQGRAGVLELQRLQRFQRKVVAVQGFGWGRREVRMRQQPPYDALIHPSHACEPAAGVVAARAAGLDQEIDHPVPRPRIEGDQVVRPRPVGDVGHASDVQHRQRRLQLRLSRPRQVIDRGQRSPLPARRHVCRAEIERHRTPGQLRKARRVAELDRSAGNAVPGPLMQHRLAVHADEVDFRPGEPVLGQEAVGGEVVLIGHGRIGAGEDLRTRFAPTPPQRLSRRLQQEIARGVGQLSLAGRPEAADGLAVGLQDRHVDRVQRGPGHEAQHAHAA